jgi:hypothetical protein
MKIYVAHARKGNYLGELYAPLRESALSKTHTFIFPHDERSEPFDSRPVITKDCDLVIAEVSEPATGLGIELGWASLSDVPIICIHRSDAKVSQSLRGVTDIFLSYENAAEMIEKISDVVVDMMQDIPR